jgi:hypothetical protein
LNPIGTAITREDGTIECWHRGRLHREDGPAVMYGGRHLVVRLGVSGYYESVRLRGPVNLWFRSGQLHREGGPAIQDIDRSEIWYVAGKLHRTDGPAIISRHSGMQWWCLDGEVHRDGAPAIQNEYDAIEWDNWVFGTGAEIWFKHASFTEPTRPRYGTTTGTNGGIETANSTARMVRLS